jgi:spermidine synthase
VPDLRVTLKKMSYRPLESSLQKALLASAGKPFCFDDGAYRYLFLDERLMQSVMSIGNPVELLFGYTRAMMCFLLFNPVPRHILMVGLGGGSLAKYCYHYLPSTRITILEIDHDVIALRDKFDIPRDSERFRVIHTEAAAWLATAPSDVDVLLVDGFNADGIAPELHSQDFYASCHDVLTAEGVLATNFWTEATNLHILASRLHLEFDYQVWRIRSPDSSNSLYFSMKTDGKSLLPSGWVKRARHLEEHFKLALPEMARQLRATTEDRMGPRHQPSHCSFDD